MKPTIAPAVSPPDGPARHADDETADTVSTENSSPEGNRNAPIFAGPDLGAGARADRRHRHAPVAPSPAS